MAEFFNGEKTPELVMPGYVRDVLVSARSGYPRALMLPFLLIQMRRFAAENGNAQSKTLPTRGLPGWLARFALSLVCYAYPGGIVVESLLFARTPAVLQNPDVVAIWAVFFVLSQFADSFFLFRLLWSILNLTPIVALAKVIFIADLTRLGILFLEKAEQYAVDKLSADVSKWEKQATLVFWAGVTFCVAPGVLKGIFFGKATPWRAVADEQDSASGDSGFSIKKTFETFHAFVAANWVPLLQSGGMLLYCAHILRYRCRQLSSAIEAAADELPRPRSFARCLEAGPDPYVEVIVMLTLVTTVCDIVTVILTGVEQRRKAELAAINSPVTIPSTSGTAGGNRIEGKKRQ
ncbi:unnamed protein product [Amoebophrya sp. A25]|nr:unnamed protein product [Amoebophrya sp. A25]|eukprot:GSA25T00018277001.1